MEVGHIQGYAFNTLAPWVYLETPLTANLTYISIIATKCDHLLQALASTLHLSHFQSSPPIMEFQESFKNNQ